MLFVLWNLCPGCFMIQVRSRGCLMKRCLMTFLFLVGSIFEPMHKPTSALSMLEEMVSHRWNLGELTAAA